MTWWNPLSWGRTDGGLMVPPARVVDRIDGYDPQEARRAHLISDPSMDPDVATALAMQAHNDAAAAFERGRITLDDVAELRQSLFDGYVNNMTGLGDWLRDKSLGGTPLGPDFMVRIVNGVEAEDRWRGSDLGGRIIETLPKEMTRRGWRVQIQPSEDDTEVMDDARRAFRRLHNRMLARGDQRRAARVRAVMDAFGMDPGLSQPAHTPGPLPEADQDGTRVVEWMDHRCEEMGVIGELKSALNYRQAFGGGALLMLVDDGEQDLTRPLDWRRVRRIVGVRAYRGGWDGELIAWRYQNDPRRPRFGEPEVYMLRNLGVPISSPPAPGEILRQPQPVPAGPTGSLIFFVHASRLLPLNGVEVSKRIRVLMRGWSDSIFTRVDEVLAQYGQSWSGLAILLQEASMKVVKIEDGAAAFASGSLKDRQKLRNRAIVMQMMESIAKMKFIDAKETFERVEVGTLAGMAEVLREMALRVAAAANIPLSRLMGQTQGGLGDASKGDQRDFYDYVQGEQETELQPQVRRFCRGLLLSAESPTGGVLPKRWTVSMNPLVQMDDKARAEYRKLIADTDKIYEDMGAVSPEEVAGTRFGGSDYNDGPLVLDLQTREAANLEDLEPEDPPSGAGAPALPAAPGQSALPPHVDPAPAGATPQHPSAPAPPGAGGANPDTGQDIHDPQQPARPPG